MYENENSMKQLWKNVKDNVTQAAAEKTTNKKGIVRLRIRKQN